MTELKDIETQCEAVTASYSALAAIIGKYNRERTRVVIRHLKGLREAAETYKMERDTLEQMLEENPDLFEKPKSRKLHDVKCGYRKKAGKIVIDNPDKTVDLIKKKLTDQADVLINTKETPDKKALSDLKASDLKKVGVSVVEDTDEPFIKIEADDIEKIVAALLAEGEQS